MPRFSYLQFEPDSDDANVPGSADVTKPSEGWKGRDVNDSLRAGYSALRNLGDVSAKLPLNSDGTVNYGPNSADGRLGTAAFQNTGSFDNVVLGPNVRGSVGGSALLMVVCDVADIPTILADQRTRGFDLCDGRNTPDPYSPFTRRINMPNFLGLFPWFTDDFAKTNTYQFGGLDERNSSGGNAIAANRLLTITGHTHGIGGFQLGYNELPQVVTSVTPTTSGNFQDGEGRGINVQTNGVPGSGLGNPHTHAISATPDVSTTFNIRPPAIAVLPFLRVW